MRLIFLLEYRTILHENSASAPVFLELVSCEVKKNIRFSYSLLTAFKNAMRELPHNLSVERARLFSFHEYASSVLKHYR